MKKELVNSKNKIASLQHQIDDAQKDVDFAKEIRNQLPDFNDEDIEEAIKLLIIISLLMLSKSVELILTYQISKMMKRRTKQCQDLENLLAFLIKEH